MPIELLKNVLRLDIDDPGLKYEDLKNHKHFKLYAFSCFFYTISGIIRIHQGSRQDGFNLILQSFLSFMSDVYTMGERSYWHIIDRYYALSISIYHFYSLKTRRSFVINFLLFLIGYKFLKKSQYYHTTRSDKILIEHTKWHCVAPIMAITSNI